MNPIACNYNVLATSPSSCSYANPGYDCYDNCLDDLDLDGICDELEVVGCTDFLAFNYNPYSTDDGYCEYLGCTDSLFVEFNPNATIDDQSCETLIVYGCIDTNADNYDSNANVSDNSCVFNNITDPYIEVLINSDIPLDAYLEGTDIFIEYSYLKRRTDFKLGFKRKLIFLENDEDYLYHKYQYNSIYFVSSYPISKFSRIEISPEYKYSQFNDLDYRVLNTTPIPHLTESKFNYIGIKTRIIFDNTKKIAMNLQQGTKLKFGFENYNSLKATQNNFNKFYFDI